MDLAFRDPAVLERPVSEIMSPAMPMIGIGEPIPAVVDRLEPLARGARARRRAPGRRAQPLRPPDVPRVEGGGVTDRPDGPGFETRAIHAGQDADPATGAVVVPIHLATTFAQDAVGEHRGFEYGRSGNPTRGALEACIASLEGAAHGLAFSSGLAAEDAVLRALLAAGRPRRDPGRRVRRDVPARLEGARPHRGPLERRRSSSHRKRCVPRWTDATKVVWVETPTNPTLGIVDIAAVAERRARAWRGARGRQHLRDPVPPAAARARRRRRRALDDQVPGRSLRRRRRLRRGRRLRAGRRGSGSCRTRSGGVPSPFDCYLVLRGIKTLGVRMDRHCANAAAVAEMLDAHPAVERVLYPGLAGAPGPRGRGPPDGRLRRDGQLPRRGRGGRRARAGRPHQGVHAGRVARRGRVADRAPGPDDPRLRRGLTARGRSRRWSGSRSGSRPSPTSSPTSSRRSPDPDRAVLGTLNHSGVVRRAENGRAENGIGPRYPGVDAGPGGDRGGGAGVPGPARRRAAPEPRRDPPCTARPGCGPRSARAAWSDLARRATDAGAERAPARSRPATTSRG